PRFAGTRFPGGALARRVRVGRRRSARTGIAPAGARPGVAGRRAAPSRAGGYRVPRTRRHAGAGRVRRRDDVLAMALAIGAAVPLFVHRGDLLTAAAKALLLLLAAMGLNVAMGYAGAPALGQDGFAAIGAYTTAILVARHHWDPVAAAIVAVAFSLVAASVVARGVARIRPPFVALATWLFSWATAFAIAAFPMLTGGDNGMPIGQPAFRLHALGIGWRPGAPAYYEIALVAVAIVLVLNTSWTRRYGPALA